MITLSPEILSKWSVLIQAAKDYLEEQNSPKLHENEILNQKQAYEAFQADLKNANIKITLKFQTLTSIKIKCFNQKYEYNKIKISL